ncbi:MAG: ribonuclease P protein component [Bacteroidetes bacterium]|nr:ribonuclease P protein component [Bacteroidota bacterium]
MRQTFTKDERLCKKVLIAKLFQEGFSFYLHPYRVTFLETALPGKFPAQILISVPKHLVRKAVHRNRIKRRIREAYRKNKGILYEGLTGKQKQMAFCITYTSKEILPYGLMQEKIILLLLRLREGHAEAAG